MSENQQKGRQQMKKTLETLLRELARAATEDGYEYGVEVLDAVAAGWDALAATTTTKVEAGAASMRVKLEDGSINVYHGTDKALLLTVSGVRAGTWDALWALMESSGKLEYRAGKAVAS